MNTLCSCTHVINVGLNQLVEFVLVNGGTLDENHPIHLHGHSFAVLGMNKLGSSVLIQDIKKMDALGKLQRNFVNPIIKDTVKVPMGGYTIIRLFTNNPGPWLMHCHVDSHAQTGMKLILKVGEDQDLPPKPVDWPQCINFPSK